MRTRSLMIAAALALSACGSDPSEPSSTLPDCVEVWVEGGQLPDDYDGCRLDGQTVEAQVFDCIKDAGTQLVSYRDASKPPRVFYAQRGEEIAETTDATAFLVC